jgi:hypothetical protein
MPMPGGTPRLPRSAPDGYTWTCRNGGVSMKKTDGLWLLKIFDLAAFLGTVTVNVLANSLPIGGRTTGELSDLYPNLFVPAPVTFSIWGLIYLLLGIFVVYQIAAPAGSRIVSKAGLPFLLASAANMSWIFLWHHQRVAASLLAMVVLLGSLLTIYVRLDIGRKVSSWSEKLLAQLPFSVYLGWITVATIANLTVVLVYTGWNRFGLSEQAWTVIVLVIAALIALALLFRRNDVFFALVILWAFLGILIKRLAVDQPPSRAVITTLWVCMAVVGAGLLLRIPRWLRS